MSRVNTERLQVSVSPELYEWLRMLAAGRRSISETAREILEREWHESLLIPALEGDGQARAILEQARAGDDGLPGKRDPAVADTTALGSGDRIADAPGRSAAPAPAPVRNQGDPAPWPGETLTKRDKTLPWSIICRSRDRHRVGVVCPECKGTGPR